MFKLATKNFIISVSKCQEWNFHCVLNQYSSLIFLNLKTTNLPHTIYKKWSTMFHNCQNGPHWKLISKVRLTVIQIWLSVFLSLQINMLIHIPWQKLHLNFHSKLHTWMDGRRDGGRVGGRDGGMGGGLEMHHDLFPWRKWSATPSIFPPNTSFALLSCDSLRRDAFLDCLFVWCSEVFYTPG